MAKHIFILGAGCSVNAGIPTMDHFIERARDIVISNSDNEELKRYQELFMLLINLRKIHSSITVDLNNLESIYTLLEIASITGSIDNAENYIEILESLILKTIIESSPLVYQGYDLIPDESYSFFVRFLKDYAKESAIITFNYDLHLDHALTSNNLTPQYYIDSENVEIPNGIPLLKLHGSLNWERDNDNSINVVKPRPIELSGKTDDQKKTLEHLCSNKPVIIPPSWDKSNKHQGMKPVWKKAADVLENAEFLHIIGYSLPITDSFFKNLLGLGIKDSFIKAINIYNPDTNVNKKYEDLFGIGLNGKVGFHNSNSGYFNVNKSGALHILDKFYNGGSFFYV